MSALPLLSVLTVANGSDGISVTAASLAAQTDPAWEWRLVVSAAADVVAGLTRWAQAEPRITVIEPATDATGLPLTAAIDMAAGEFACVVEPGGTLSADTVGVLRHWVGTGTVGWLYTDEAVPYANGAGAEVWFKPDFSPELLRSCPYAVSSAMLPLSAIRRVGGLRPQTADAAWYDLVLRVAEVLPDPVHIAGPYMSRRAARKPVEAPWVDASAASRCQVVAEHCERVGIGLLDVSPVEVAGRPIGQRIHRRMKRVPRISLVVPTRGDSTIIHGFLRCHVVELVRELWTEDRYPELEIVIVYDDATPATVLEDLSAITGGAVVLLPFHGPFHFSRKCNVGALAATGEYLCFLNDDIEPKTRDWLAEMAPLLEDPTVGAVGAKLLFADGTLQHAGHSYDGSPGHLLFGAAADTLECGGVAQLTSERSGVTGACLLMRVADFIEVGGFSELFPLNFNDVDLCLKIRAKGMRIIYHPHAILYHFESQTRVSRVTPTEISTIERRWGHTLRTDPYINALTRISLE